MLIKKIVGIGACDETGVLGNNGKIPWHYPEDVKHFYNTTLGAPLVMGRNTFLSMPSHYFKDRRSIVFSRSPQQQQPNLFFVSSLTEFFAIDITCDELYVIGGAQIYTLFLTHNLIQEFILTKIKKRYAGDAFFPLALLNDWPCVKVCETDAFNIYRYQNAHKDI